MKRLLTTFKVLFFIVLFLDQCQRNFFWVMPKSGYYREFFRDIYPMADFFLYDTLSQDIIEKNPYIFSVIARPLSMLCDDIDGIKVFVPKKC